MIMHALPKGLTSDRRENMDGNGQVAAVPPGFRFHPTDEELLCYYLRKKVAYQVIDLDVIRDVDLNKLEPWDLKDRCRIGSGPQNEWYFFSHKDKKYPTGTRTNRATTAGFWKATGRDKAIHHGNSKKIGMRKTLVFYTGRAPHGQKTEWIMHEYRLNDDGNQAQGTNCDMQEDGWVVCRVFKKKSHHMRGFGPAEEPQEDIYVNHLMKTGPGGGGGSHSEPAIVHQQYAAGFTFHGSMHLPQLLTPDQLTISPSFSNTMDAECSHNLLKLTSGMGGVCGGLFSTPHERFQGDWSFLDKLLASQQGADQQFCQSRWNSSALSQNVDVGAACPLSVQKFPFHYLGAAGDETGLDLSKYPK